MADVLTNSVLRQPIWALGDGNPEVIATLRRARESFASRCDQVSLLLARTFHEHRVGETYEVDRARRILFGTWTLPVGQPDVWTFLPSFFAERRWRSYSAFCDWVREDAPHVAEASRASCDTFFHLIVCVDPAGRIWPDMALVPFTTSQSAHTRLRVLPVPFLSERERQQVRTSDDPDPRALSPWARHALKYVGEGSEDELTRALSASTSSDVDALLRCVRSGELDGLREAASAIARHASVAKPGDRLVAVLLNAYRWAQPVASPEALQNHPAGREILQTAYERLTEGLQAAELVGDPMVIARFCSFVGHADILLGNAPAAVSHLESGAAVLEATPPSRTVDELLLDLLGAYGAALREADRSLEALPVLERALTVARRLAMGRDPGDVLGISRAHNNIGSLLCDLRRAGARAHLTDALRAFDTLPADTRRANGSLSAGILYNLGLEAVRAHDLNLADRQLTRAEVLYRELISREGDGYRPRLAETLICHAHAMAAAQEFEDALALSAEAVPILRELVRRDDSLSRDLGIALNGQASIEKSLHRFSAAQRTLEESLSLYRRLATAQPAMFGGDVAFTLSALADVLREQDALDEALRLSDEGVTLRRDLAAVEWHAHASALADEIRVRGVILIEQRRLEEGRNLLEEAVGVWRTLIADSTPEQSTTLDTALSDLGNAYTLLGQSDLAITRYDESIALRRKHGRWIDAGTALMNLAVLHHRMGREKEELAVCREAIAACERGLRTVRDVRHRHLAKATIETALAVLLQDAGRTLDRRHASSRAQELVGIMDALRNADALVGLDGSSDPTEEPNLLMNTVEGRGEFARLLRGARAAVLYIHVAQPDTFFVAVAPGLLEVKRIGGDWIEKLHALFDAVHAAVTKNAFAESALASLGVEAFGSMPAPIQALLAESPYDVVFLAPCRATINLPFELLCLPGEPDAARAGFLGLRQALPRTRGLRELRTALLRDPRNLRGRRALVVGNPLHRGSAPLDGARRLALWAATKLKAAGFELASGAPLLDDKASNRAVGDLAKGAELRLWHHLGHGGRAPREDGGGIEYLALAGNDRLLPGEIRDMNLSQSLVWLDCCVTGTTRGRGGGHLEGHPTAALDAGAAAVLASVHPIFDEPAVEFGRLLYDALLDGRPGAGIGAATVAARREMHRRYAGHAAVWSTPVIWGNPLARLS